MNTKNWKSRLLIQRILKDFKKTGNKFWQSRLFFGYVSVINTVICTSQLCKKKTKKKKTPPEDKEDIVHLYSMVCSYLRWLIWACQIPKDLYLPFL